MKLKKVGMPALVWSMCWLLGNLAGNVSAQGAPLPEQNHTAEYLTPEEQSWRESAFYRTIIENNIFRPLGWTPPKPMPVYRLLGTIISTDGTNGRSILQEIASERFHFLRVGDSVGDATVTEVLLKEVKLDKSGRRMSLKMGRLQFLSPTRTRQQGKIAAQTSVSQAYESPTDQIKSVSREKRKRLIQRYYPR
ncbi:hypothetical protein F4Z99_04180 [Candidatus Poribacteria bacterium]|nr:hypothetical protein [Candidatus Poribacteria bacterium]MYB00931.1 hypothetical protein [Candidatus Poribacteria bacterium]